MKKRLQSCPHCGIRMAIAIRDGRTRLLCPSCDSDPVKLPKIYEIIDAAQRRKNDHKGP